MGVSLRKAINEKCKQCTYDPLSGLGNWRQQIMACTVSSCALHPIRPVSKPRNASNDSDEDVMQMWCGPNESVSEMLAREVEKSHN